MLYGPGMGLWMPSHVVLDQAPGGGGGGGGIAYVSGVKAESPDGGNVTSSTIDTTTATLIVVGVSDYGSNAAAATLSDSKGNTWIPLTAYKSTAGGGIDARVRLHYCLAPTVGSGHTFSATNGSENIYGNLYAAAYSGVASFDSGKDSGAIVTSAGTTIQPGSQTPSVNNCLVVTAMCAWNGETPTVSGYTVRQSSVYVPSAHLGGGFADLIQTTAGATNPTWSWSTSTYNPRVAASAVFRSA